MLTAVLGVVFLAGPSVRAEAPNGIYPSPRVAAASARAGAASAGVVAASGVVVAASGVVVAALRGSLAPLQALRPNRETLANGFELLSLADAGAGPRVFGTLYVRFGELDEPEGQEGAAKLLAATWLAGGSEVTSGESLQGWLAERGASLDVEALTDHLSLDFQCASKDLAALYGKLGELLTRPRYPEATIVAARAEIAASVEDGDDDEHEPYRVLERFALTPATRAGRTATRASLLALDRDEVLFLHRAFLVPDRMLLGLCGAVDAAALEATRAFANALPALETDRRDHSTYLEAPERTTVLLAADAEPHLWLVSRVPGVGDADGALFAWALAGELGTVDAVVAARQRDAGVTGPNVRRVLENSEWAYSSLRVDSAIDPARAASALAELARLFAPAEFAALQPAAKYAASASTPLDTPSARRVIESALLDAIRPSPRAKPALAPSAADLETVAARWLDPNKVWVLATGPVDVLAKAFAPTCDVRVLDATRTVASTPEALARLELVFAALGGRARFGALTSLATSGETVLSNGEAIRTRQVRDFAGFRLWQEQTRGAAVDVTVVDASGATTFRGANAQQQPSAMHSRLVRRSSCHLFQLLHDLAGGARRGVRLGRDGALEVLAPDGVLCWVELDHSNRPARLGWTEDKTSDGAVFVYGDWRTFDGYAYPASIEQPELGVRTQTSSLEVNVPLDERLFRRVQSR